MATDIIKQYCVIGTPVAHSRSPELFARIFEERGITDSRYSINEIKTIEELDDFFTQMRRGFRAGCNVTMPWKTEAVKYMDELTSQSRLTGSVNTVAMRDGRLIGGTTDGKGMVKAIEESGRDTGGAAVVILGTGGAARSILAAFAAEPVKSVALAGREGHNCELAKSLIDRIAVPSPRCYIFDYDDREVFLSELRNADIIINCTPLGMKPQENALPVPEDYCFRPEQIVADAVYEPLMTRLLERAAAQGCTTVCGSRMLYWQARESAKMFLDNVPESSVP